ncbi:MAG: U32 family peptidase [Deltaproteobacteria bacterium]|nr:U32 family peptidase [Deltaproteobacteria bacterium]
MELIVAITGQEALDAALAAEVAGVTVNLPRNPDRAWWAAVEAWQAAARSHGVRFSLQWDRLVPEKELPQAQKALAALAALNPDALALRDLGLCREARLRHPGLSLHAAGSLGFHNSPGLRLAETLGFSRVVLESPMPLKDLALLRRQTDLPLEVVLPHPCPGFGHLCLLDDYLVSGGGCPSCCLPARWQADAAASLLTALEMLPGLAQVGVAAVRLGGVFSQGGPLSRSLELCRLMLDASPAGRPRVLAAAREVLAAFGAEFWCEFPPQETRPGKQPLGPPPAGRGAPAVTGRPRTAPGPGRIWLEARDYAEAIALAPAWREPLILQLTPENYHAFLAQFRQWDRRRLVWRLPPMIRESALSFFQQAIATLKQGGFSRFVAGDWGAVALARQAGGEIYGDQTLGVRNSLALIAARDLTVSKVCLFLGRGPGDWQELVQAAPRGSFWGYLYQLPALAVCAPGSLALPSRESGPGGEKLRWIVEGDLGFLCPEVPQELGNLQDWFRQNAVAPLVVSLPHSGQPWGQVPALARPQPAPQSPAESRGRPQPRGRRRT